MSQEARSALVDLGKKYGRLYKLTIDNVPHIGSLVFAFRPLTILEYKCYKSFNFRRPDAWFMAEEEILRLCLVQPIENQAEKLTADYIDTITADVEDEAVSAIDFIDLLPVGVVSSVVNAILYVSYPKDVSGWNTALDLERLRQSGDVEYRLRGIVSAVYGYKPEDLEDITFSKLVEKVIMAETMLMANKPGLPILIHEQQEEEETSKPEESRELNKAEKFQSSARYLAGEGFTAEDEELARNVGLMPRPGDRPNPKEVYDRLRGR